MAQRPIVTLTTDFGLNDHFVGTLKGVILNVVPDANVVDICHSVQAFDILDGALALAQSYAYFPAGTVHLVIVDPGVGSARRPIVATSEAHHFVAPDNGVLSLMYAREQRMSVRHITAEHYFLQPISNTFHGIFSRRLQATWRKAWMTRSLARRLPTTSASTRRVRSRERVTCCVAWFCVSTASET
jgi:S-adenosylmethionine hydrolase